MAENQKIAIKDLKLSEYNPRKITEQELKKLERSITEFGFIVPIIINQSPERMNVVIGGHQRIKVAEKLGMTEVPYMAVHLELTKERALNLALNKIGGEFEEEQLTELLMKIEEENEDILSLTGFSNEEVNYLLGLADREKEKIFASSIEDSYEMGNKHGIEPWDIVVLEGKHKIICGDSTDPNVIRQLLGEKKADLVVTSPPYNLDIKYGKYSDNQDYKNYLYMIEKIFANLMDFMSKGTEGRYICINIGREWGPINMPSKYDQILEGIGYTFFRNIYWKKPLGSARGDSMRNPFPRYYKPKVQTEIIQIYAVDEQPENLNSMIMYESSSTIGKRRDELIPKILTSKYAGNVWEFNTEGQLRGDHPTPFPVQLPYNCIRFFSFEGERIVDPFLGSGSTLIAADQLKRKCYGIEIDPNYVSVAIERFMLYKPDAKFEIIKSKETKQ